MAGRKQQLPHRLENRLWKAGYALISFQGARDACDYILINQLQPEDTIYYPLVTAIAVLYARPFKHSKGIERLTSQFIPKKFQRLHDDLILIRDQSSAHVDARGGLREGLPENSVKLVIRGSGSDVTMGVDRWSWSTTMILHTRYLASALAERMLNYIGKLVSQYPNDVPDGDYQIDLTTGTLLPLKRVPGEPLPPLFTLDPEERTGEAKATAGSYDEAGDVIETHEHAGDFKEW
jgi:hypothetical protein